MPLYDYSCDTCMMTTESLEPIGTEYIECPHCGRTAQKILSFRSEPVWNEDAEWIRSVLDVVDKSNNAPHVAEFRRYPTRENYRKWMAGEGIRPLESGENRTKSRRDKESQSIRDIARSVLRMRSDRRRIEL